MKYTVIFTTGYDDDIDSLSKELRGDILILDEVGNYFNPTFISIARVNGEFTEDKICFLDDNPVILHQVSKDVILKSIKELDRWQFYKKWIPLTSEQIEKYFYPKEVWVSFEIV